MERWLSSERNVRICAVLGAITIAFSSILVRLSHASPSTAAIFRCAYALPVLGLLAWLEDRRLGRAPWRERRVASPPGVFFAADLILWHHSIEDVGAGPGHGARQHPGRARPARRLGGAVGEAGRQVLAALPLALLGVFLISGVLEHGAYGRDPGARRGVRARRRDRLRRLPAAAAPRRVGSAPAGRSAVRRDRGGDRVLRARRAGSSATATWSRRGRAPRWLITLALTSQVLGWLLIISSLPRLPAAMTSLLLTVQPVGSVALAALIFGESPSPLQLAGVVLVLAALLHRDPAFAAAGVQGISGDRRRLRQPLDCGVHVGLGELRVLEVARQVGVVRGQVEVAVAR